MSARRVTLLCEALPQGSRTMVAIGGPEAIWSNEMVLLGTISERIDGLHHSYIKSQGGRAKKPEPIVPRPKKHRRPARDTESVLASLDKTLARIGGE